MKLSFIVTPYFECIGVLFGCFSFKKRKALVYLVVQSSTRAIYFPKRTPMIEYVVNFNSSEHVSIARSWPGSPGATMAAAYDPSLAAGAHPVLDLHALRLFCLVRGAFWFDATLRSACTCICKNRCKMKLLSSSGIRT